jgi:hypothetical protein
VAPYLVPYLPQIPTFLVWFPCNLIQWNESATEPNSIQKKDPKVDRVVHNHTHITWAGLTILDKRFVRQQQKLPAVNEAWARFSVDSARAAGSSIRAKTIGVCVTFGMHKDANTLLPEIISHFLRSQK